MVVIKLEIKKHFLHTFSKYEYTIYERGRENTENKIKKEYHLLKMDILKVGHHGFRNSTIRKF